MIAENRFAGIAALIGERSRAVMLWHLLGDKALTATELAMCANVSPQSASMHLNKLVTAGMLSVEKLGRHRYYRFAGPEAAYAVEAIANLLPAESGVRASVVRGVDDIRYCRTCYDHLAGRVGVLLTDRLLTHNLILRAGSEFDASRKGAGWFRSMGIDVAELRNLRRDFARACLDWSERRPHLAGALGAALLESMLGSDWIRRVKQSRSVILTPKGRRRMYELLGLEV
jgi:DNA-binding transcriptional ArsR family regulator